MPTTYTEGSVTYTFPDNYTVFRPEDSTFYAKRWQNFSVNPGCEGNAETDFVVFDSSSKRLWLIEAKDYRQHIRTKPSEIGQEFARKCRDTLSLLGALQISDQVAAEDDLATRQHFSKMRSVSCILHFEQSKGSHGEYSIISPQNLKDTVRRNLRALDPHAKAGDAALLKDYPVPFTITL